MSCEKKIIAAVRTESEFERAINSKIETIFLLDSDIMSLKAMAQKAHLKNKKIFVHIDFTTGLGKDKLGIEYAKNMGVDGIISTRANLIKFARECGLKTVQRFFIVDSRAVDTTVETIKSSRADMIEVMPGIVPKIIKILKGRIDAPIIAGGLVEIGEEVFMAIESGAYAVSTSCVALWDL